jgi:hypothetical protein
LRRGPCYAERGGRERREREEGERGGRERRERDEGQEGERREREDLEFRV